MKQQKLTGYMPNYPKKILQGSALTAAAIALLGSTIGCKKAPVPGLEPDVAGYVPVEPNETLVLDGEVAIDPGEELIVDPTPDPDETLVLDGEVAVDPGEELILDGDVLVDDSQEDFTTTGMIDVAND